MEKLNIGLHLQLRLIQEEEKTRGKRMNGLNFRFEVAMQKRLVGEGGKTNPEQLFAAGYAACFGGLWALLQASQFARIPDIKAKVILEIMLAGSFGLAVDIEVKFPHAAIPPPLFFWGGKKKEKGPPPPQKKKIS